jgi:hypothetical protein
VYQPSTIARPRLERRLDGALGRRLTCVVAGTGTDEVGRAHGYAGRICEALATVQRWCSTTWRRSAAPPSRRRSWPGCAGRALDHAERARDLRQIIRIRLNRGSRLNEEADDKRVDSHRPR